MASAASTSQKHKDFIAEPIGNKEITAIAGIGPVLGERLSKKGFDKAYILLGKFLVLKKDQTLFCDWLKETCGGSNAKQSADTYTCLKEWCNSYI